MPRSVSVIATVGAAFGMAMIFGQNAARLEAPPLVGYLFAGVLIRPATPGFVFVADGALAEQRASARASCLRRDAVTDAIDMRKVVEAAKALTPASS